MTHKPIRVRQHIRRTSRGKRTVVRTHRRRRPRR